MKTAVRPHVQPEREWAAEVLRKAGARAKVIWRVLAPRDTGDPAELLFTTWDGEARSALVYPDGGVELADGW